MSVRLSEIKEVFAENVELFEDHTDGEYLSLIVFLMYELLKGMGSMTVGEKSFWKPYLDVLPNVDFLALWSETDLLQLQDPELLKEAVEYREAVDEEWIEVKAMLNKYPTYFPPEGVTKELFIFAYGNVVMRCFGWSLPCTMLIPMADALNHSPIDTSNEMVDIQLHEAATSESSEIHKVSKVRAYATRSKMLISYPDIISSRQPKQYAIKPLVIDDDVVTLNSQSLAETDINIWNV
eukprot:TRINITY_DN9344_c0_g1_i7.p1 TRINITY_DN9344_c0_g1~~TRINITY_DN9344_c0_g1_i7.p1  ORF type:complete len:237 (-),score=45.03 TRINITY_DN9344_c0_g1_i7:936-1646(-)